MNIDLFKAPNIRQGLERTRILIVEEERVIGWAEAEMLAAAGCEVVGPATTFEEAIQLIGTTVIDAAIVDGTIKGNLAAEILWVLRTGNIPFAIITAYGPIAGRNRLPRQFRDTLVLDKPFMAWHLVAAVEALLNRRFPK